ncbi:MAG: GTPase HflX [Magnetococcales bacterium]|nr:GTPase HflX [Magnetococcales bacterium]NGZ26210.1 GTPase HflX [Magnetococcales bacterium]
MAELLDTRPPAERAFLLHVLEGEENRTQGESLLSELEHLATTAGLEVTGRHVFSLHRMIPATCIGKGQVEILATKLEELAIQVLVVNRPLSPVQQRNLERHLQVKVVDRTGIILEIFAARAKTREGSLQVELASLMYQQSRLVRSWTHLERQRGGVGLRGGPGEKQIELDRRMIREKIVKLEKLLVGVNRTRSLHRASREAVPFFTVALVGYTNTGKSTLFNRLANAQVEAEDKLFATLDPTMRAIRLPGGGRAILSDTVGFIRQLPHALVAAFRATLEEVREADLLLHVVDIADPEWEVQVAAVEEVLQELEAHHKPTLTLYNKIDLLDPNTAVLERVLQAENTLAISARNGQGLDKLLEIIAAREVERMDIWHLRVPVTDGRFLAQLQRQGRVLQQEEEGEFLLLKVAMSTASHGELRQLLLDYALPSPQ